MYYKIVGLQYLSLFNLQSPPVWCLILYCIALYCIVLYRIVLYCIVSYPIILYCIVLHCILLYCIVSYCIVLYLSYRIVLHYIVSYRIILYCIVPYRIMSYCTVLYCIVYRCTSNPSHKCYTKLHQIFRIWIANDEFWTVNESVWVQHFVCVEFFYLCEIPSRNSVQKAAVADWRTAFWSSTLKYCKWEYDVIVFDVHL